MQASFPIRRADEVCVALAARRILPRMATPAGAADAIGEPEDEDLMLAYARGDAAAFDALYGRHKGGVFRYLRRHCGTSAADELFQDVWMNVIRARASYAPTARFATWLYRIAHNRVIDHWRASGEHVSREDDETCMEAAPASRTSEPHVQAQSRELRDRVDAALRALPPLQRDAVLLHEETGLSLAEIGALTDTAVETVKSRLRYASARLRTLLEDLR